MSSRVLFSLSALLLTSSLIFTTNAVNNHPLESLLLKRQDCYSAAQADCSKNDPEACIKAICDSCGAVYPEIANCCLSSDPTAMATCVSNALEGGSGSTASSVPPSGTITSSASPADSSADPNLGACLQVGTIIDNCNSQTSGFTDLSTFSSQASCLCYTSSTFAPSIFDGYFESCLSYYSSASPRAYSSLTAENGGTQGACSAVGDVVNGPASVSASRTGVSSRSTSSARNTENSSRSFVGVSAQSATSSASGSSRTASSSVATQTSAAVRSWSQPFLLSLVLLLRFALFL
ncbi:hypothetical protein GJ744_011758 [Endocarpon pusillum]|uniref:Extracellular membrane protein CFEM domain-containing protein n=1 Tax=Endocarpon pusillum TaxID=364733 RepID=A0A8H7AFC2_9EURO|nr:hypothetical protein GJ744_011758 [Endocarpon pusillum]